MLAINYSTMRKNLKKYLDSATEKNETVIITRKAEKSAVLLSLNQYNEMLKAFNNAEYLAKIDTSVEQIKSGHVQEHELIEI